MLITAEDVTQRKHDPEGFLKAAARLGVPVGEFLIWRPSVIGCPELAVIQYD
jgi:hypothetical protein